jgi:hypothetical protein
MLDFHNMSLDVKDYQATMSYVMDAVVELQESVKSLENKMIKRLENLEIILGEKE